MPRKKHRIGLNKFQKSAIKEGEVRIRESEFRMYLALADSVDPRDRLEAAANLCPCHVRHPVPEVQQALYRLMEDPNEKVRARAWHTLDDGRIPNDPQMEAIIERALKSDTRNEIIRYIPKILKEREHKEKTSWKMAIRSEFDQSGKCDFCNKSGIRVKTDFDTEIPDNGKIRLALICEKCDTTGI